MGLALLLLLPGSIVNALNARELTCAVQSHVSSVVMCYYGQVHTSIPLGMLVCIPNGMLGLLDPSLKRKQK